MRDGPCPSPLCPPGTGPANFLDDLPPPRGVRCPAPPGPPGQPAIRAPRAQDIATLGYAGVWIFMSSAVILYNKFLLNRLPFPFPVSLTMFHMLFGSVASWGMIQFGWAQKEEKMDRDMYMRTIAPIALLFAGVLWLGNTAYLYLSVSFIQMTKALMPAIVFGVSIVFGLAAMTSDKALNIAFICFGVMLASFGELNFNAFGFSLQIASCVIEAVRLSLIQILLQRRGLKMNPITTLYYIAPACFVCLLVPFFAVDYPKMFPAGVPLDDLPWVWAPGHMVGNALCAFGLNVCVFLFVGKTSALTMNLAGVVKDWLLIVLSWLLFGDPVTGLNLFGYFLAFLGLLYWNREKLFGTQAAGGAAHKPLPAAGGAGYRPVEADPEDPKPPGRGVEMGGRSEN